MTVADILSRVRSLTYNPSTVNPADSDLIAMLNQAKDALVGWLLTIQPEFLEGTAALLSYVAGQQEYSLPQTLSRVLLVEVTDLGNIPIRLTPGRFEDRDLWPGWAEPYRYYWRTDDSGNPLIGFMPAPGRDGSQNVTVTYVPSIPDVAATTDTPAIPVELHPALVYGTALLQRERDQQPMQTFAALYQDQLDKYASLVLEGRGALGRRVIWRP